MKNALILLSALAMATGGFPYGAAADDRAVLTYHAHQNRSGNFIVPGLTFERARAVHMDQDFQARFPGHVYAQPLYWHSPGAEQAMLIVATEDDALYAFDAKTGQEIWSRSLGKPIRRSSLGCGNIDPLGITGTPAIDPASESIYLDAMAETASGPRHLVFGLSLKDGSILPGWPVDITEALKAKGETFIARDQNERGALLILNETVYVPFGGHWGDCGTYRGWIVGISLKDPKSVVTWATRARGGGIWAPGGIATDGNRLFFATGNTFQAKDFGDGEAVLRLAQDLRRSTASHDFFAPADWRKLDGLDADLGGTNPLPLDLPTEGGTQALVLALGKDRRAYLLDRQNLGGIGGALRVETVSSEAIRTAPAAYPGDEAVFVAFQGQGASCPSRGFGGRAGSTGVGLTMLKIGVGSPPSIGTAWCGALNGEGAPIVTTTDGRSDPIVWVVGAEGDNRLHGFRGDTGEPLFAGGGKADAMSGLHHFQTLIAAGGRLYVAADGRVYVFAF